MSRQLVIIAGGQGTRLRARIGDLPKVMAPVGGRPLIDHQLQLARKHDFDNVLMLTGYRAEAIESFCGNGDRWGIHVQYQREAEARGTAGAVLEAIERLEDRFCIMYGDTMLDVDLGRMWAAHTATGADATLFVHPNDHPHDSDLVEVDSVGRVVAIRPYPHPLGSFYPNLVNAALYVVEKRVLERYRDFGGRPDFGKHLFPQMAMDGCLLRAYKTAEYIKDAGTPERLDRVEADYQSGKIARRAYPNLQPAVLLDRDGTLNVEKDRISDPADLELIPGVGEAVGRLNRSDYLAIVITNQPVVARGDCSEADLARIHNKLETLLGSEHAYVDAIYYCPHHPDKGFVGERPDLKFACDCRKPSIGLVRQAATEIPIDLARSWFVGDSTVDLQTAANAGVRALLVQTGHAGLDGRFRAEPEAVFASLGAAVDYILANTESL